MNILLTCAGRRNYIVDYFQVALSPFGGKVFAANSVPLAAALLAADQGFVVPSLYEPNYVDVLIEICRRHAIQAIVPLFDLELPVLAQARERLAALGVQAVVSAPEVVDICNDKWRTIDFLEKLGLPSPRTYLGLEPALEALDSREIAFPLIVKPRWGMGSIGLLEAEDKAELQVFYSKARRAIETSYLATESRRDPTRAVLIQEKLRGQEYGLDVVNDLQRRHVVTFVKKKMAMRAGETDAAVTVDEPRLAQLGEQLAAGLKHTANLDVDLFMTDHGPCVLEMNPRLGGGYPFSHLAGANLPAAIVAWVRGEPPDPSWLEVRYNITGLKGIVPMSTGDTLMDYSAGVPRDLSGAHLKDEAE